MNIKYTYFDKDLFYSICVWLIRMYVQHMNTVPKEARRGRHIPLKWSYWWLSVDMWAMGIQLNLGSLEMQSVLLTLSHLYSPHLFLNLIETY